MSRQDQALRYKEANPDFEEEDSSGDFGVLSF